MWQRIEWIYGIISNDFICHRKSHTSKYTLLMRFLREPTPLIIRSTASMTISKQNLLIDKYISDQRPAGHQSTHRTTVMNAYTRRHVSRRHRTPLGCPLGGRAMTANSAGNRKGCRLYTGNILFVPLHKKRNKTSSGRWSCRSPASHNRGCT